ncbi:copper chaperone PCu(A)C [Mycobacterium sp. GA-2829]|uniref:copper chaperone PCu(A)C n=1 Tax=Mycobacterium sp. GA-2829 TaxID=1772283 RepID=UPI00073FE8F2|nr:copper chaperone PCu(A)C [Mycobacterium sp. GA-2829]KUI28438.1 hypothetical protein AU194_19505 [Mycobacterium sp. GA-2829]
MRGLLSAVCAVLVLVGCGGPAAREDAAAVEVRDAWVKAAETGMTAAFAQLRNSADREVRVVSAATTAAARVELHEVVGESAPRMQPKAGGFVLPAGGATELNPGGDHLMLMELTGPLPPGSDVEITLTFGDGSTLPMTAQVREFAGAGEQYDGGHHG